MTKDGKRVFFARTKEEYKRMIKTLFTEFEIVVDIETYITLIPQLLANEITHTAEPIMLGLMVVISVPEDDNYKIKIIEREEAPESFFKDLSDMFN